MLKPLFITLLSCLPQLVFAQPETLNKTINGLKEGHWILGGSDLSCATCKREEGVYKNDQRQGKWTHYFPDGKTIKWKFIYVDDRPTGKYEKYHENGTLKETGTFIKNKYRGVLKRYYPSGCIRYDANYNEQGHEDGIVTYYFDCINQTTHPIGPIEYRYKAENGIGIDTGKRYYKNGDLKELVMYKDGEVQKRKQFERTHLPIGPNPAEPIIPEP